jgi:hypothetical protein
MEVSANEDHYHSINSWPKVADGFVQLSQYSHHTHRTMQTKSLNIKAESFYDIPMQRRAEERHVNMDMAIT